MRYGNIAAVLLVAAALTGCSRSGSSDGEDGQRVAVVDSAGGEQMAAGHNQHAAQTTAAGEPAVAGVNAIDHAAMGHGGAATSNAEPLHTEGHGGATQAAPGAMVGMEHRGAAAPPHTGGVSSARPGDGAGHTAHAAAPSRGGVEPVGTHALHAAEPAEATAANQTQASRSANSTLTAHAAHAATATTAASGSDAGTERLLELARELVRDPVVQERIQEDSALREAWSDPGVRAVILRQP